MKDLIWKLQPYLTGGLIGWLAFWPPARLASKDNPFLGPVLSQRGAHEEIRRLLSGG